MRVAVVGLGRMGEPIARRLLNAGHELTVFNRTPGRAGDLIELGAREVSSLQDIWDTADVCITMVADDEALRAVTLDEGGLLRTSAADRAVIDMSTVSPIGSQSVADAAEAAGVVFLRAPVSGNPSVVQAGNLGIMASGDEETFRRLEPMLRDIGPNVFYVGGAEEARVMKLALQILVAGTAQLIAEALVFGEAGGLERATMLEVMGSSAVGSPFVKYKTAALVENDYTPTFTSSAMSKDLGLVLDTARRAQVDLPVSTLIHGLVEECISTGLGEADFIALLPRLQREAGLEPAVKY